MQDSVLEQYFTAIKEDANHKEERFDKLEAMMEQIARSMAMFFEMHGIHELTINYHNTTLSNHERRIGKLERPLA